MLKNHNVKFLQIFKSNFRTFKGYLYSDSGDFQHERQFQFVFKHHNENLDLIGHCNQCSGLQSWTHNNFTLAALNKKITTILFFQGLFDQIIKIKMFLGVQGSQ